MYNPFFRFDEKRFNNGTFCFFFFKRFTGIGFSMIYVSAVLIPGFYFDKWRALATGISVCGSGIGTFVLAPMNVILVENYGWRFTIQIQAGKRYLLSRVDA